VLKVYPPICHAVKHLFCSLQKKVIIIKVYPLICHAVKHLFYSLLKKVIIIKVYPPNLSCCQASHSFLPKKNNNHKNVPPTISDKLNQFLSLSKILHNHFKKEILNRMTNVGLMIKSQLFCF
jgi:hypothetical protein